MPVRFTSLFGLARAVPFALLLAGCSVTQPGATDADRRAYMLKNLAGKPHPWTAHFHATVAIGLPDGQVLFADGNCYGEILPEERGDNGFGYDPIFLIPSLGRTLAELTRSEKAGLSHRGQAMRAMAPKLARL